MRTCRAVPSVRVAFAVARPVRTMAPSRRRSARATRAAARHPRLRAGEPLGVGGAGAVWAARGGGRDAAIKVAHSLRRAVARRASPARRARWRRSARRTRRGSSPTTSCPTGARGSRWSGSSARAWPTRWPTCAAPPSSRRGLAGRRGAGRRRALHGRGLAHGDLTPENVFVRGPAGRPRRSSTSASPPAGASAPIDRPGWTMGTLGYMAPEVLSGGPGDARADVYALGVILYELFTLRPPFAGDAAELERAHLALRPPPPGLFADIPRALDELILACLAKDPERRPPDAVGRAPRARRVLTGEASRSTAETSPSIADTHTGDAAGADTRPAAPGLDRADTRPPTPWPRHARMRAGGASDTRRLAGAGAGRARLARVRRRPGAHRRRDRAHARRARPPARPHLPGPVRRRPLRATGARGAGRRLPAPGHLGRPRRASRRSRRAAPRATAARPPPTASRSIARGVAAGRALDRPGPDPRLLPTPSATWPWCRPSRPASSPRPARSPPPRRRWSAAPRSSPRSRPARAPASPTAGPASSLLLGGPGSGKSRLLAEIAAAAGELGAAHIVIDAAGQARPIGSTARRCASAPARGPLAVLVDDAHLADDAFLDSLEYATLGGASVPLWVLVAADGRALDQNPAALRRARRPDGAPRARAARRRRHARARRLAAVPGRLPARGRARSPGLAGRRQPGPADRAGPRPQARGGGAPAPRPAQPRAGHRGDRAPARHRRRAAGRRRARSTGCRTSWPRPRGWRPRSARSSTRASSTGSRTRSSARATAASSTRGVALRALATRGLVVDRGGGSWAFASPLVQDAIYQAIPAAERSRIHRHALDYWRGRERRARDGRGGAPRRAGRRARRGGGRRAGPGRGGGRRPPRGRGGEVVLGGAPARQRSARPACARWSAAAASAGGSTAGRRRCRIWPPRASWPAARRPGRGWPRSCSTRRWCSTGSSTSPRRPNGSREARPLVERAAMPASAARLLVATGRTLWRQERVAEALALFAEERGAAARRRDAPHRAAPVRLARSAWVGQPRRGRGGLHRGRASGRTPRTTGCTCACSTSTGSSCGRRATTPSAAPTTCAAPSGWPASSATRTWSAPRPTTWPSSSTSRAATRRRFRSPSARSSCSSASRPGPAPRTRSCSAASRSPWAIASRPPATWPGWRRTRPCRRAAHRTASSTARSTWSSTGAAAEAWDAVVADAAGRAPGRAPRDPLPAGRLRARRGDRWRRPAARSRPRARMSIGSRRGTRGSRRWQQALLHGGTCSSRRPSRRRKASISSP